MVVVTVDLVAMVMQMVMVVEVMRMMTVTMSRVFETMMAGAGGEPPC